MEEAEALSDRIGIMKDGKLLALGTAEELKAKAGTEKFEDAFVAIVKGAAGITVFGLSFMTLFAAVLVSKDRESALLQRLYTTPLTATDFIFGYTLPILPIAVAQAVICYIVA